MPSTIEKCKLFRIKHTTLLEGETFLRNKHEIAFFKIKCTYFGRKENTIIFDGTTQIIVQRCQIGAPRWPNDNSSAADNAIFKNGALNIECSFGYVAHTAVLLKPNVC